MFGLNVLAQFVRDGAALLDWVDRAQPHFCVVMDDLSTAQAIRVVAPETTVIYRQWFPNEAEKHWHQTHSPQAWLNAHRDYALPGIVLQAFNEPHGYEDLRPLAAWCAELMALAHDAGIRLCLVNWGVGHPDEARIAAGELDDLFRAFDRFPEHLYGVHEYAVADMQAEQPFRIARYTRSLERIDALQLKRPRIVITESGRDIGGGENDGWRAVFSPNQYADFLTGSIATYRRDGVAACLYCYGAGAVSSASGQPQWRAFDIEGASAVLDRLTEVNDMTQAPDFGTLIPVEVTGAFAGGSVVRSAPSLDGRELARVFTGDFIDLSERAVSGGVHQWRRARVGAVEGYIAETSVLAWRALEPPVDPHPPLAIPPLEWDPSGRVSRQELAAWYRAMADLIEHGVIDTTPGA